MRKKTKKEKSTDKKTDTSPKKEYKKPVLYRWEINMRPAFAVPQPEFEY